MAPSLVTTLAAEEMNRALYPAVLFVSEQLGAPGILADVAFMKVSALLHGYYYSKYNASLSDYYWNIARSFNPVPPSQGDLSSALNPSRIPDTMTRLRRILSYLEVVLGPYLGLKLREMYTDWVHDGQPSRRTMFCGLIRFYPTINLLFVVGDVLCKLRYHFKYSEYSSLSNAVLRVRSVPLTPLPGQSPRGILAHTAQIIFPLAMFAVQFLRQWSAVEQPVYQTRIMPPPHYQPPETPDVCPICHTGLSIPTAVPTTGYVYCYVCVYKFVKEHQRCPVTKLPIDVGSLIKLNFC